MTPRGKKIKNAYTQLAHRHSSTDFATLPILWCYKGLQVVKVKPRVGTILQPSTLGYYAEIGRLLEDILSTPLLQDQAQHFYMGKLRKMSLQDYPEHPSARLTGQAVKLSAPELRRREAPSFHPNTGLSGWHADP